MQSNVTQHLINASDIDAALDNILKNRASGYTFTVDADAPVRVLNAVIKAAARHAEASVTVAGPETIEDRIRQRHLDAAHQIVDLAVDRLRNYELIGEPGPVHIVRHIQDDPARPYVAQLAETRGMRLISWSVNHPELGQSINIRIGKA